MEYHVIKDGWDSDFKTTSKRIPKTDHIMVENVPCVVPNVILTSEHIISMWQKLPDISLYDTLRHMEMMWVAKSLANTPYPGQSECSMQQDRWLREMETKSIYINSENNHWFISGYFQEPIREATSEEIEIQNTFHTLRCLFTAQKLTSSGE